VADLPNVAGSVLPFGRDISHGEMTALMGDCTAGASKLMIGMGRGWRGGGNL